MLVPSLEVRDLHHTRHDPTLLLTNASDNTTQHHTQAGKYYVCRQAICDFLTQWQQYGVLVAVSKILPTGPRAWPLFFSPIHGPWNVPVFSLQSRRERYGREIYLLTS